MIDKPIFLIGMMGSGKTSLARALSRELSIPLLDTDLEIEKEVGLTIAEMFSRYGEAFFRAKEQELTVSLTAEPKIVACGGGLPCYHGLMQMLLDKGVVIYLEAPVKTLFERINTGNERPLLADFDNFNQRFMERNDVYQLAHYRLDANQSEQQVLSVCLELLSTNPS